MFMDQAPRLSDVTLEEDADVPLPPIVLPASIRHRGFCGDAARIVQGVDEEAALYVLEGAGIFKIGITRDLEQRLKGLRAQCPVPISLITWFAVRVDVASWAEYVAHVALSPFHHHDEWFRCPRRTAREVCRIASVRANDIPPDWWKEPGRHFKDYVPMYVHTSKYMKVADAFFYPHLPSKIRQLNN